jgi:hypothetical protein
LARRPRYPAYVRDSNFTWSCGTCPAVLAAPDLEALRAAVLGHIRSACRRGVTELRCGHCGGTMTEDAASVNQHTNYFDDADPSIGPRCGYIRPMERLVL